MALREKTWGDLTLRLAAEGYLDAAGIERVGAAAAELRPPAATPWYVHVLVGASAWLAAVLFLFFLIAADRVEEGQDFLVAGIAMTVLALALAHRSRALFLQQLSVALGVAGSFCATFGVHAIADDGRLTWAVLALLAVTLFLLHPVALHRVLSVLSGVAGVAGWIAAANAEPLVHLLVMGLCLGTIYVWERESLYDARRWHPHTRPLGYGAALALPALLLAIDVLPVFGGEALWMSSAGLSVGLMYLVRRAVVLQGLGRAGGLQASLVVFLGLFCAFAFETPGLIAALVLLLLAFGRGNAPLIGFSVAAFVANLVYLFVSLGIDRLNKAFVLAGCGVVLLAMRKILQLMLPTSHPAAGGGGKS